MWLNYVRVFFIAFFIAIRYSSELISDENRAWEFLHCRQDALLHRCQAGDNWWEYFDVGMSTHNFTWQNFTDPLLRRAFLKTGGHENWYAISAEKSYMEQSKRMGELVRECRSIFYNSRACVYDEKEQKAEENCTLETQYEISEKFQKVGNAKERKHYWIAWRDSVGKMRKAFGKLINAEKVSNEYPNMWLGIYKDTSPSIEEDVDRAFQEILPLYKELHAYVRRRLIGVYGNEGINRNGPIPSHLLDLVGNSWWPVKDVVLPYPEEEADITEAMKERNMTAIDMLKEAEDFYHSLGLPNIDDNVWNNTNVSTDGRCGIRLTLHRTYCQFRNKINGITGCLRADEFYLRRVIGSIVNLYTIGEDRHDWPSSIYEMPNNAFASGLQITAEMSTWSNEYMALKGFVQPIYPDTDQVTTVRDMNDLMKAALFFLPTLPYIYKEIKWRMASYGPTISDKNYNKKWWEYSLAYQGICPPTRRTEENFDVASSTRISTGYYLLKEFIGIVYGFQFYKAICNETEHRDLLHRCSLYGKKQFGDKIREIVYLGNSVTPPEAMLMMTNGESDQMDTKPLLEYFQPLYEWLKKENDKEIIGWNSDDPMVCP